MLEGRTKGNSTGRFGKKQSESIKSPFDDSLQSSVLQFEPNKFPDRADSNLQPQSHTVSIRECPATALAPTEDEFVASQQEIVILSPVTSSIPRTSSIMDDSCEQTERMRADGHIDAYSESSERQSKKQREVIFHLSN